MQFVMVIRPELSRHIGKRVEPESVESALFRPPDTILDKILRHVGVILIEVGQNIEEPAIHDVFPLAGRRGRIPDELKGTGGKGVLGPRPAITTRVRLKTRARGAYSGVVH